MQVDINKKIEVYKDTFKDDPLLAEIVAVGLEDELFAPCYLYERVLFEMTYSTKQATELLEMPGKEQTLLNYLNRDDLKSYIEIFRSGPRGFYRYSYKTLFQFKMIFLLIESGRTPFDIATIAGTRPEYSNTSNNNRLQRKTTTNQQLIGESDVDELVSQRTQQFFTHFVTPYIQKLEENIEENNLLINQQEKDNKLNILRKELEIWESHMNGLVGRIEDIELNIDIYKNILKRLPSASLQDKKSFWWRLFGSAPIPSDKENEEYQLKLNELEERHKSLINEKKAMDESKEKLLESIKLAEEEYKESQQLNPAKNDENKKFLTEE